MNWFKKISQDILEQYEKLPQSVGSVKIEGTGANHTINIGGKNLPIRPILDQAISMIKPVLIEKGVHTIDTGGLEPSAQGLYISSEPGKIRVDVAKIANSFHNAMSPIVQTDGTKMDDDVYNQIAQKLSEEIKKELGATSLHESEHNFDSQEIYQNWKKDPSKPLNFQQMTEQRAVDFEKSMRSKYFNQ